MSAKLTRSLRLGDHGLDVKATRRALKRFLGEGPPRIPSKAQEVFGPGMLDLVKRAQDEMALGKTGVVGEKTIEALNRGCSGATCCFDAYGLHLLDLYASRRPDMCFPAPIGFEARVCQGLHPTAGLLGNWAIDFCARPGVPILAVESGKIRKLSGHDPNDDLWDAQGVFGWSVHFETDYGYRYFLTHLGRRPALIIGQRVQVGTTLGWVGDQEFRPDHNHYGVTSPLGVRDAKKRITAVSKAPRVKVS